MVVCKIVALPKGKGVASEEGGWFFSSWICLFFFCGVNRILKRFFLSGCLWSQTFLAIHLSTLKSRNLFIGIFSNFITASQILVGGLC
jgi:hypothetical protein